MVLLFTVCSCKKPPQPPAYRTYFVRVTEPVQQDVSLYQEYVGHIEAYTTVNIKSQIEGVLIKQHFKDGQEVKQNDLLFTIDPRPYEAALEKAQATLTQNIVNLKYAQDTAFRYSKLVQDNYVSQLDYDQYISQVLTNEAIIQQNLADVETAKLNLGYCFITAPVDSMTSNVQIYEGNLVSNAGDTIVTLNQLTPIKLSFYIPEKDLPYLQKLHKEKPLEVQAFLEGDPDNVYCGTLFLINNGVDETTGTILLQATFPNEDKALWPGEFVSVRVITKKQEGALLLPISAIQNGRQGPTIFVVKEDNTVELRIVTQGQRMGDFVVINEGVCAGEKVVLEGQINLYQGAHIAIKKGAS